MSSLATIDLKGLFELSQKRSGCQIRVKVNTRMSQDKIVAVCDIDKFLTDLSKQRYVELLCQGNTVLRLVTDDYELTRPVQKEDVTSILDREMQQNDTDGRSLTTEAQKTGQDQEMTDNIVRRSLQIPARYRSRIEGSGGCYLEYLQRQFSVTTVMNGRKLHIKGTKENAEACYKVVKELLVHWQKRESSEG